MLLVIQSESVNKTKKPGVKLEIMLIHLVQGFPALSFEISSGWPLLLAPISFDSLLTSHFPLIDAARKETLEIQELVYLLCHGYYT